MQVKLKILVKSAEVATPGNAQPQQQQQQQQQAQPVAEGFGSRITNRLKRGSVSSIDPFCVMEIDGVEVMTQRLQARIV